MPLVRFEVRNYVGLVDPCLYGGGAGAGKRAGGSGGEGGGKRAGGSGDAGAGKRAGGSGGAGAGKRGGGEAEPKALLEGIVVAGLVEILRQLGDLAESMVGSVAPRVW